MKLLANENIPLASVVALSYAGHDVFCLSKEAPGMADKDVLALAQAQDRVVVTFDRDYGELIYSQGLPTPPAVIYLRFMASHPAEPAHVLLDLLRQESAIAGYFFVVEKSSLRRRPLPDN